MDLTDAGSGYEECVYGTMPSEVKDSIHLIYMEDLFPGTNVGPVGQNNAHSIVKNEMVYVSVHKTAVSSTPDRCLTVIAGETKLCAGDSIYLDASASCGSAYKWNTGASTAGIWVSSIGTYSCEITTPCGKITEEVEVTTPQQGGAGPNVSLTADLNTLCPSGSQTVLRVNHSSIGTSGFYNWNGNTSTSTVDTFLVTGPGTYSVRVTNCVGGSTTETITINSVTEAKATISGRKFLCPGDSTTLMVSENPDGTYEWRLSGSSSVLSNSSSLKVTQTGTYVVDVSACNRTFTAKDSIKVEVEPAATASLTSAGTTTICKGEAPLSLVANGQVGATYKWFDGSTGGFYTVNTDSVHTFGYFFHSFNACGDSAKSNVINVTVKALPSAPTISYNGTTYSGAGANGKWYFQKRGTTTWVDAGVTGDTYTPTNLQGGDKVMARVVENGCESANSNELVDVTSVLQLGNSGGMVNVFPNPASGSVNVSFTGTENGEVSISIRNMVGQEVASKAVTLSGDHTENIDLSHLETGVYMVVISNDDKQVSQQLIVK
jgi:hypothetical protein